MQKILCPSCGSLIWDFEVQEYTLNGEIKYICEHCVHSKEYEDLIDILDCRR